MARKGHSRLELRRQAEAAEAQGGDAEAAPKAPKAKKAAGEKAKKAPSKGKKSKERPAQRKRLVWVVFSPSMKEEGRFAYDQRAAADEKLEALKLKHKKPYFIQPVKEVISETGAVISPSKSSRKAAEVVEVVEEEVVEEQAEEVEAEEAEAEEEEEEEEEEESEE